MSIKCKEWKEISNLIITTRFFEHCFMSTLTPFNVTRIMFYVFIHRSDFTHLTAIFFSTLTVLLCQKNLH